MIAFFDKIHDFIVTLPSKNAILQEKLTKNKIAITEDDIQNNFLVNLCSDVMDEIILSDESKKTSLSGQISYGALVKTIVFLILIPYKLYITFQILLNIMCVILWIFAILSGFSLFILITIFSTFTCIWFAIKFPIIGIVMSPLIIFLVYALGLYVTNE
jgi:hypothetical protein